MKALLISVFFSVDPENRPSRFFNIGMLILISLNVIAVILATVNSIYLRHKVFFDAFEVFSVIVFTIEYVLRLWLCTSQRGFEPSVSGRIKFALQPLQLIDLIAILPFFLPVVGLDLRFVRAVRLFRLFRLFKIGRYSQSLRTISNVLKSKKEELWITVFTGFILLIFASSLMYIVENNAQPDKFKSIPDAMWWGAATLTTVGYGDIYPVTILGKILGSIIAMLGIGLFALPAGIVASGFASEIQKNKREKKICPHCGKEIND